MNYELMNNNKVFLSGKVISQPEFSHETFGEAFYEVNVAVPRLSSHEDVLPVIVSEKLLKNNDFDIDNEVSIKGQFRSYNKIVEGKSKLMLTVFVRELVDKIPDINPNIIEIVGFLCKPPIYRTTPFKREICDILIAVNRAYNKSDYLPCIAWGRNARFIKDVEVGAKVQIVGRIQSREYKKKISEDEIITKTAYEISVSKISLPGEENEFSEESETDEII